MELRQLTYFVSVAEELHFGRAAARVGIAQPSLTQQIQRLERELDVMLLDRNSHAVGLTSAGELFLSKAQATIRLADDATAAARPGTAREARLPPGGTVRVGYTYAAGIRLLPATLRRLLRIRPRVRVKLAELWSGQQLEALVCGELDVGFVFGPVAHPELRVRALCREPFTALVPAGHRLATAPVEFPDFASEPLVWFRRELSPAIYDRFSCAAADADVTLNVRYEAEHPRVMRLLVASEHALGIVTASCASAIRDPGIVPRQLRGGPAGEDLSLVWRAAEPHPLVSEFVEAVGPPARAAPDRRGLS
jgi:DNA-binding transcriptional LysR family regulator